MVVFWCCLFCYVANTNPIILPTLWCLVQETENNSAYQTAEDEALGMDSTVETLDAGDQTGDASGISILAGENTSELLQDSSQAEQDSMVSREGGGGGDDEGASLFEWLFLSVPFFSKFFA